MKNISLLAGLMAGLLIVPAYAAQTPKSLGYDARVQYVNYNPDNVVNIRTKIGFATLVQLQEGETVQKDESSGVGMGYGKAWDFTVKGRNLFFKPVKHEPETNLLITTNKRTYIFHIGLVKGKTAPTYVLRFNYPGEKAFVRQQQIELEAQAASILRTAKSKASRASDYNRKYWGKGDKDLAPTEAFDDGRFTYLRYDNARSLPAVFKVNSDGSEAAVNSHVEGDTLVIHETSKDFVLRQGKAVLGVENRSYDSVGEFNHTGTTGNNTVRLRKGSQK